jgi:hypothetical protein
MKWASSFVTYIVFKDAASNFGNISYTFLAMTFPFDPGFSIPTLTFFIFLKLSKIKFIAFYFFILSFCSSSDVKTLLLISSMFCIFILKGSAILPPNL